jgi:hypothetical protein
MTHGAILYNQKAEAQREKIAARQRRKQKKQAKTKNYLTQRDKEYIIVMAACTQGIQNIWTDGRSMTNTRFCFGV